MDVVVLVVRVLVHVVVLLVVVLEFLIIVLLVLSLLLAGVGVGSDVGSDGDGCGGGGGLACLLAFLTVFGRCVFILMAYLRFAFWLSDGPDSMNEHNAPDCSYGLRCLSASDNTRPVLRSKMLKASQKNSARWRQWQCPSCRWGMRESFALAFAA